jgi:hypothetical protein
VKVLESQFKSKLLKALRARMPGAVVWALSARFITGMPDAVVVYEGRTTWFEMKIGSNPLTKIQFETLRRLRRAYEVRWDRNAGVIGAVLYKDFDSLVEAMVRLCIQP